MTDLESFTSEIRKSGVPPEGVTLCNCEVSGEQLLLLIESMQHNVVTDDGWK